MAGVGAGSAGPEGGSPPPASRESTTPAQAPGSGNRDMREFQGFIKRRDKVKLRDQSLNVQTEGGVDVGDLAKRAAEAKQAAAAFTQEGTPQGILNEPLTGAFKMTEAGGQSQPARPEPAGNWPTNEAELNQRVQELAERTKAAEQTKQQLAGPAEGAPTETPGVLNGPMQGAFKDRARASGSTEGVLNEPMIGAWKYRGDVAPDTQGVLNEPVKGAFKFREVDEESGHKEALHPAVAAWLKGVQEKLGIPDSAVLGEEAREVFKAFMDTFKGVKPPAEWDVPAPDTNAGNAPATGSPGPTPAK